MQPSEDLVAAVKDALEHFYDQAYLLRHVLVLQVQAAVAASPPAAVQELRRLLAQAVEDLRPGQGTPSSEPAWRPYCVLHGRFVLGRDLKEVAQQLALSRRQVLREQRRGLEAVALSLQQRLHSGSPMPGEPRSSDLSEEISRLASQSRGLELLEWLRSSMSPVQALAQRCAVELVPPAGSGPVYAFCTPSLLRQLVVAVLSQAVRLVPGGKVETRVVRRGQVAMISCTASLASGSKWQPGQATLPPAAVMLAEAQGAHLVAQATDSALSVEISLSQQRREHLVAMIEDNQDVVQLFSRYLAGHGYRIIGIDDPEHASEAILSLGPDAILLDVMMGGVDGWEVLQQLKANTVLKHIPVVVCSVLDEPELALALGADAYLRKPVRPLQLLDCLSAILARQPRA